MTDVSVEPDSMVAKMLGMLFDSRNGQDAEARPSAKSGEDALAVAKAFVERQALGGIRLINRNVAQPDVVAVVGRAAELRLELDMLQSVAGKHVRFLQDDHPIAEAEVGEDRVALVDYIPEQAGCRDLDFELVSDSGTEVSDYRSDQEVLLHVIDTQPVICVDAAILLSEKHEDRAVLRAFTDVDFDLIYVDFGKNDQTETLRRVRRQEQLPRGAIVPLSARIRRFESFSVDFRGTFLSLTMRRLRAKGVPVVGLISDCALSEAQQVDGVALLSPGARPDKKQVSRLRRRATLFVQERDDTSELPWRIAQMVTAEPVAGNACSYEMNNRDARLALFSALDGAKKSIDLQFYIFRECRFTHELAMHLAKASKRGVEVRMMVDALWSNENFLGTWNAFLHKINRLKNIEILAADPVRISDSLDALKLRRRDHRKICVIDRKLAIISGRNASDEYYYDWSEVPIADWTDAERIPWLDAHVQVEGPVVADIQNLFDDVWLRNGGDEKWVRKARRSKAIGDSTVQLVIHEGTDDANGLAAYEALIGGAQSHLYLVNDFPVLDDIAELLIRAVRRGVRVHFLTGNVLARRIDGTFFDGGLHRELFEHVIKSRLGSLVDAGVHVVEFETPQLANIACEGGRVRPYVHAKMVTADGRYASIGSANLDVTASYWEREANLLLDDTDLVGRLDAELDAMLDAGHVLDLDSEQWQREAAQRDLVARFWPITYLS